MPRTLLVWSTLRIALCGGPLSTQLRTVLCGRQQVWFGCPPMSSCESLPLTLEGPGAWAQLSRVCSMGVLSAPAGLAPCFLADRLGALGLVSSMGVGNRVHRAEQGLQPSLDSDLGGRQSMRAGWYQQPRACWPLWLFRRTLLPTTGIALLSCCPHPAVPPAGTFRLALPLQPASCSHVSLQLLCFHYTPQMASGILQPTP